MEEIGFSHIDEQGMPRMVDISKKKITQRRALATGKILMKKETLKLIKEGRIEKGNVLNTAVLSGIQGAKKTSELILLSHPLNITSCDIKFFFEDDGIRLTSEVCLSGKTGPEMEALVSCSLACLNIYDMVKSVDKEIKITDIYLLEKQGGKSDRARQGGRP